MAGISNFLADKINDWLHGSNTYVPSGTTYFALMLAMPTASGGGTEASATGYARLSYLNNATNWGTATNGIKTNQTTMTWATPSTNIGAVIGIAEYDAVTSGNLLTFANLASAVTILSGQVFSLPVGGANYTWSGGITQFLSNHLNDWLHGAGVYTVPTPTYFALMQTASTQTTVGTEATGSGYSRSSYANTAADWPASSGQTKSNANAVAWGPATGNWAGPEVAVTEFDASTSGNALTFGSIPAAVTINSGASPQIPANAAVYSVQ